MGKNFRSRDTAHFVGLDGLRGVAAFAVACLHAGEWFRLPYDGGSIYLAVDFFFMLSGFVIALAYDGKLDEGMEWREFFRIRLIRLYPMLFIGILAGGAVLAVKVIQSHSASLTQCLALTSLSLLLLPAGMLWGQAPYTIDGPTWSLFFELTANAVFATRLRRARSSVALGALAAACLALVAVAYHYGGIGDLGLSDSPSFLFGFVRVAVPFSIGVALFRAQLFKHVPVIPFELAALALAITLIVRVHTVWIYDLASVFFIFPLLVCVGARSSLSSLSKSFCQIGGRLSYPLYIIHVPIMRAIYGSLKASRFGGPLLYPAIAAAFVSVAVSYLVLRLYDEPVRAWLTKKRRSSRPALDGRGPQTPPTLGANQAEQV